ncbi:cytochrome b [Altererythrobacter sp. MF3-039]|uniref:cytochrome b n=1 Tax=Altererythrobacter sp. MF3-039 TaxID=3252901 RepID=UPI00390C9A3B
MTERIGKKYSGLAMAIHWLIAVLVIVQWRIAEAGEHAATDEARGAIMSNHFSIGIIIFALVAIRLVVRITGTPPGRPASHAPWERILARTTHTLFYILLLVMPMAGWFAMSKYGAPVSVFGVFSLPALPVGVDPDAGKAIFESHATAGMILLILVALHVLGTLKHTLLDKDGNIFRMLPFGQPKA